MRGCGDCDLTRKWRDWGYAWLREWLHLPRVQDPKGLGPISWPAFREAPSPCGYLPGLTLENLS